MPTVIWIALAGSVVAAVLLCTPSFVRLLSRSAPARQPPEQPDGLHLGTVTMPFRGLGSPSVAEATGRLVRVKAVQSGRWVFTLRHLWVSADLGLPAVGLVLDGSISSTAEGALVAVFMPVASVVPIALVWTLLLIGSVSMLLITPSPQAAVFVMFLIALAYLSWRRARRAVTLVAEDAVAALQQSGSTAA